VRNPARGGVSRGLVGCSEAVLVYTYKQPQEILASGPEATRGWCVSPWLFSNELKLFIRINSLAGAGGLGGVYTYKQLAMGSHSHAVRADG